MVRVTSLQRLAGVLAALAGLAPATAQAKVVVVRSGDAPVIEAITKGFRSQFVGEPFEDVQVGDARSEAALAKKLDGATAVLSVGAKAAAAVAKAGHAGYTIAVVPAAQADPAQLGPTMRLQVPADGLVAAVGWLSGRFDRVGLVLEAGAVERRTIAEVEGTKRGIELVARMAKDSRELVTIVGDLVAETDIVIVDLSEGLQASDVQFMLRAAQAAKVPLLGTSEGFVKLGAPGAIAIDPENVGREAARAAKAGTRGMFDPRRFRLHVNLVAMERLGVEVSRERGTVENNILVLDADAEELGRATRPVTITRAGVIRQGRLKFPEIARRNNIRAGEVILEVLVRADGTVGDTKVLKGNAIFATAAVDSIKTWKFRPGTRDGAPVDDTMRLNLRFQE